MSFLKKPQFQWLSVGILFSAITSAYLFNFGNGGQQPLIPEEGISIPSIGLGLWNSKDKDATHAVKYAFKAGYQHFDSAAAYSNEEFVGKGLNSTKLPRSYYWVTSKLWNTAHQPKQVPKALKKTLSELGIPYLDLYLMHWPVAFFPNKDGRTVVDKETSIVDTWKAMEELVRANLTRHIGISNFSPRQVDEILANCEICPYAHEFETHPYLQQREFVAWHQEHDIKVIAYSPLANVNPTYDKKYPDMKSILEDPFWLDLAAKKNSTAAQAILAWGIQRGTIVIPKSVHEDRIVENLGSINITFTEKELIKIAEQDKRSRFNDPSESWGVELFEGLDDGSNRFV